jgi:ubiquinone/menaquinone biosynthesis C-methylase UbiE
MGFSAAPWLDRTNREEEEKISLMVRKLGIKKGMVIADVGAGSGRISVMLAKSTGKKGLVYGVDIQKEMLNLIRKKAKQKGLKQLIATLATEKDPKLPKNKIDLAIMVDVYHELLWPQEVMLSLSRSLVKGGLLVLIEYRGEDKKLPIKRLHKMTIAQVIKEMSLKILGLKYHKTVAVLPRQHMIFFQKRRL